MSLFIALGNVQRVRLTTQILPHMFSLNLWGNKTIRALLVQRAIYVYSCLCLETICTYKNVLVLYWFLFICYICRCLLKLLLSGQRTFATSWPFVTIYTPQTGSLYDITATFLAVLWARKRTVLTITSWCVTSSNLKKKWILRENYFVCVYCIPNYIPVTFFYISRKHEHTHHIFLLHTNRWLCHPYTNHIWVRDWHILHETCMVYCTPYAHFE